MSRTTVASVIALVAVAVGFIGWALGGPPIFGFGGFLAFLASLVLYAYRGSGEDRTADDLRRADRPEKHQSHEGPGPFGPS
jgi:hypothetical protein